MGFLGLIGFGGGATSLAVGGAPSAFEATGGVKYGPAPNNKIYHIFENGTPGPTSDFVVTGVGPYTMEVFLIGGGGAGGSQHGGGGGAGALFYQPDFPMPVGTFTVSVGGGGAQTLAPQGPGGSGGNTSLGTLVVCNGGGGGGKMGDDGPQGGCGGGGGMRPINPGPHPNRQPGGEGTGAPTHPGSPYVHAYDGGTGSDYSDPQASSGGIGGGGGGAGGVGSSTPDDTPNRGPWPAPQNPAGATRGQGGNDWSAPDALFPSDVRTGMGAAMGTPTYWLGCAYPMPSTAIMMFAGGGAGGSHTPWGVFNETGWNAPNPVNPGDWGGGSGTPTLSGWGTGGIGGEGNNDIGRGGSNFRGGGGGGSGDASEQGGRGGSGICIIVYPDSTS